MCTLDPSAQRTCTVSPLLTSTSFHQYRHCILGLADSDGSTLCSPLLYQGTLRISFQRMKSILFRDHNREKGIHICEKKRTTDRCCSRPSLCTASNILIRATHWCKTPLCSLSLHHLRRMSTCCTRRTTPCNCSAFFAMSFHNPPCNPSRSLSLPAAYNLRRESTFGSRQEHSSFPQFTRQPFSSSQFRKCSLAVVVHKIWGHGQTSFPQPVWQPFSSLSKSLRSHPGFGAAHLICGHCWHLISGHVGQPFSSGGDSTLLQPLLTVGQANCGHFLSQTLSPQSTMQPCRSFLWPTSGIPSREDICVDWTTGYWGRSLQLSGNPGGAKKKAAAQSRRTVFMIIIFFFLLLSFDWRL